MSRMTEHVIQKKATAGMTLSNRGNLNMGIAVPRQPEMPNVTPVGFKMSPTMSGNVKATTVPKPEQLNNQPVKIKPPTLFAPEATPPDPTIQAAKENVPQYAIPPVR